MSVGTDWQTVDAFRALSDPRPEDIVELDIAMMRILRHYNSNRHCRTVGYSTRFPRFQKSYPDETPERELEILREHYWERYRQLGNLNRLIECKQDALERTCQHVWEMDVDSRDHRSRYNCIACGAHR